MLLIWLFALVSGWANACLVQGRASAHGWMQAENALAAQPVGGPVHSEHKEPADHDSDSARLVCQSVCDDEQSALPKVAAPSIPDLGPPTLVPIEAWSFCIAEAQVPGDRPMAAAPPPEPSVAIRFLRLTI
jgi:hypothetical protein